MGANLGRIFFSLKLINFKPNNGWKSMILGLGVRIIHILPHLIAIQMISKKLFWGTKFLKIECK
jgi:hypothetical protein